MSEENPEVNVTVELPSEELEQYIDDAVNGAMEAYDERIQGNQVSDVQLSELAQNSALVALDMQRSEQDSDATQSVYIVLTDEQWEKARTEAQLVNTLLLVLVLVTSATLGALLVRYFVQGWRK